MCIRDRLWGSASTSNIEILERLQAKVLRIITNAPWFIANREILCDLKVSSVTDEVSKCSEKYLRKLELHPNLLATNLLDNSEDTHRPKRQKVLDLSSRFKQPQSL